MKKSERNIFKPGSRLNQGFNDEYNDAEYLINVLKTTLRVIYITLSTKYLRRSRRANIL
jgi:hypothetical protein